MDYLSHPEEVKIKIIVKIGKKLEKNLEEKINKKKKWAELLSGIICSTTLILFSNSCYKD